MIGSRQWFWHLLARTVTHSTVEECQQRMSHAEFRRWQALYSVEPWDEWSHTRAIAAAVLAPWSKRKIRLNKFFPGAKSIPASEMERTLTPWVKAHNRSVNRGGNRESVDHTHRQQ